MNCDNQIKRLNVYRSFKQTLLSNKLSQAYIFISPDRVTNKMLALNLSKLLVCKVNDACLECDNCLKVQVDSHPDVLTYPKGKSFVVEDASEIYDKVQVKPMLAKYKVFIINDIDISTEQAQNKMLKIIEEPPKNVVFLITAKTEEKVLSTILSRVQKKYIDKMDKESLKSIIDNVDENVTDIALNFGEGYIGKTLEILSDDIFVKTYKNVLDLLKNLKRSDQIPFFSCFFNKDKVAFENCLFMLNDFFRDILMLHLNKENLINHSNLIDLYNNLMLEYSILAVKKILEKLNDYKHKLDRNVNLVTLVDNLLLEILEVKYLCK